MIRYFLILSICFLYIGTHKVYSQIQQDNSTEISYATSLHDLGYKYLSSNEFKTALDYTQKAVNLRRELLGENNLDYIKSLHNLALCHARLGDYKKAVLLEENVCSLIKDNISWNEVYAVATHLLGQYYYGVGDITKAIEIGKKACNLCKNILGETHNEYAASLSSLAYYYMNTAQWEDVIMLEEMALNIHKCNNHLPGIANSYFNIGVVNFNENNYSSAIEKLEYASEIFKQTNNLSYYSVLGTLILCYNKIGNHTKAILLGEEALEGFKKIFGERSHQYATTLGNLSESYMYVGNLEKYIQYTEMSLEIQEEIFGSNHHIYALALANTAFMYGTHINVKKALDMNKKAIDIFIANDMTNTLYYKTAISNQIQFNMTLRKYKEAINEINSILPQIETNSHIYADYLFKLSICYNSLEDFEKAIKYNEESLKLVESIYGKAHQSYIGGLAYQIKNLWLGGTEEELIKCLKEEAKCISLFTQNNVLTYNSEERQMWWDEIRQFYHDLGNYVFELNNKSEILNILYNGTLISKGILLNIDKGTKEAISSLKNDSIKEMYNQLQIYKRKYTNKYKQGDIYASNNLQNESSILERKLLEKIKTYLKLDNYSVTVDSIKAQLGPNEIAIEFFDYPLWEMELDSMVYAALMIKKDWPNARLIPLKAEKLIKQQYYTANDSFPKNTLYNWIWNGMILNNLIKPGDNIYFSASGILHQIPIESLPIGDGKIMSDVYNMHRLSSTRELVKEKKDIKYAKAVLYGGLNYDMTDDELLFASQTYTKDASTEYFVSRGLLEDSIRGYKWNNLSNTQQEVDYISDLMKKNQITTQTYKGNKGNEESFKTLSGHEYNIIHLATHGFFYPDEEAKEKDYFKPMLLNNHYQKYNEVDMSMWRSGLVLSGGNRAWKGDTIPDTVEDGILKAQEIGDLDLRGADLVVLSACNTGQGEVTGEGVFGLQRAFKMAGAQTIVMSLTPVDDQTTMAMMNRFYTNLFSGQSKHDAFYNAQRYIRSIKPDPKYWMGWIMLD